MDLYLLFLGVNLFLSLSHCIFPRCASSLPESDEECTIQVDKLFGLVDENTQQHLLDSSSTRLVCQSVSTSQQLTQKRVVPFLDELREELSSFDVG